MGVSGLWDVLAPAGQSRSLANIAVADGYDANTSGCRAFRIGIDASIWFKHAQFSKEGENPELRLLFFRLKDLAKLPWAVLFVFDGRQRPKVKRGSRMGKSGSHGLTLNFKRIIEAFGMEWREARGEAEAELAYLNSIGVIDAIMTDDADAFVFGAKRIIRNASVNLTGNKANPALNMDGKASKFHVMVFDAETIKNHPDIGLTRGGMVLFALLTGGDYDKGIDKFGKAVAHALARCGFGDELLYAVRHREESSLSVFFRDWRRRMNDELHTNSRGFLRRASPSLEIPENFPRLEYLDNYASPVSSELLGTQGGGAMRGRNEMNLKKIAAICEEFFEWGTRTKIIHRFRSLMWEACVFRVLRRAALDQDRKEQDNRHPAGNHSGIVGPSIRESSGTPFSLISKYLDMNRLDQLSEAFVNRDPAPRQIGPDAKPFLTKITMTRQHVSTDKMLEYRVKVDPKKFVELANAGIKGKRADNTPNAPVSDEEEEDNEEASTSNRRQSKTAKAPVDPLSPFLMWIPASIVRNVDPHLIAEYEQEMEAKKQKKVRKTTNGMPRGKRKPAESDEEEEICAEEVIPVQPSPPKRRKGLVKVSSDISRRSSQLAATLPREDANFTGTEGLNGHPNISRTSSLVRISSDTKKAGLRTPPSIDSGYVATEFTRENDRTASSSFSGANTVDDDGFPFLYKIPNPDDPDLIEREDLNGTSMKRDFSNWANLSPDNATSGLMELDDDLDLDLVDDRRDKQHEREFVKNSSALLTQNSESTHRRGITHTHLDQLKKGTKERSAISQTISTASTSRRKTGFASNVDRNSSKGAQRSAIDAHGSLSQPSFTSSFSSETPLFLPSPSTPRRTASSFSQPSYSSPLFIDDELFESPPSSQYPPSSSVGPSSPAQIRATSSSGLSMSDLARYRAAFYD